MNYPLTVAHKPAQGIAWPVGASCFTRPAARRLSPMTTEEFQLRILDALIICRDRMDAGEVVSTSDVYWAVVPVYLDAAIENRMTQDEFEGLVMGLVDGLNSMGRKLH